MHIQLIPVDLIDPHPSNPRRDLGDLTELADSIRAQGIRQNLLVTPWAGRYRAIIGHRRLAAAKLAGLVEVPAAIDEEITAEDRVHYAAGRRRKTVRIDEMLTGLERVHIEVEP